MRSKKESFYLQDIELCKELEPIMKKQKIEPDGYYGYSDITEDTLLFNEKGFASSEEQATWRKDSLEFALRKYWRWISFFAWRKGVFMKDIEDWGLDKMPTGTKGQIVDLYKTIVRSSGQESLKALTQLIIFLNKEGVEW